MLFCLISYVGGDPKQLICPGSNSRGRDVNADVLNQILVNNTRRARLHTKRNVFIYCCFTPVRLFDLLRGGEGFAVLFQKDDVGGDVRKGDYRTQGKPLASCILRNKWLPAECVMRNNIKVPSSSVSHTRAYIYIYSNDCKKKKKR